MTIADGYPFRARTLPTKILLCWFSRIYFFIFLCSTLRIVSLLPSATEIVALLGAAGDLVGRSHECDFPASITHLPVLTGQKTHCSNIDPDPAAIDAQVRETLATGQSLYTLDTQLLASLRPDIIITQDLCQVCSIDLATVRRAAAALTPSPTIISLDPHTLEQVFDDVMNVGKAINREREAESAIVQLRERMHTAQDFVNAYDDQVGVAFLEWTNPLFIGGHWTPQLIERAGGRHDLNPTIPAPDSGSASGPQMAYRKAGKSIQVSPQSLIDSNPRFIIICPCGMNFLQTRACVQQLFLQENWFASLDAVKAGRVALVDGNQYFNRPGPRLVDAFEFLVGFLQQRPEVIPPWFAWEQFKSQK